MFRRRLLALVVTGVAAVAMACSGGPVSVGQPLPVSGVSLQTASVLTCLDSSGRILVEVESTERVNPSVVKVEISDSQTSSESLSIWKSSTEPSHYAGTSTTVYPAGACLNIYIDLLCIYADYECSDWFSNTARSFGYTVSLVP